MTTVAAGAATSALAVPIARMAGARIVRPITHHTRANSLPSANPRERPDHWRLLGGCGGGDRLLATDEPKVVSGVTAVFFK